METRLDLKDLGPLENFQTFPELLRSLMRLRRHHTSYQLEQGMRAHETPLIVSRQWIDNVLTGNSKIQAGANLKSLATYFQIAEYPELETRWRELSEAQRLRPTPNSTPSTLSESPEPKAVPVAIGSPVDPEVPVMRGWRISPIAMTFALLVALVVGGGVSWRYLPSSTKYAIGVRIAAITEHLTGRPLGLADVGLSPVDWIRLTEEQIVDKVNASASWPAVDAALERGDPIALTLACFRASVGGPGHEQDERAARELCTRAAKSGDGRAAAFLADLDRPPPPHTLSDFGISQRMWDWTPARDIVPLINDIETLAYLKEARERNDRVALALSCLYAVEHSPQTIAEETCGAASKLGEGRATVALATIAHSRSANEAKTLLKSAIDQGSFYARIQLAALLGEAPLTRENVKGFLEQFEMIEMSIGNGHEDSGELALVFVRALEASYLGTDGDRNLPRAVYAASMLLGGLVAYFDNTENIHDLIQRALADDRLRRRIDIGDLVTVGRKDAANRLYVPARFTDERFRALHQGELNDILSGQYIKEGKLEVLFIPDWPNAPIVPKDYRNDQDFASHLVIFCTPSEKRYQLLEKLVGAHEERGRVPFEEIVTLAEEYSAANRWFDSCIRSADPIVSVASNVLRFKKEFGLVPGGAAINGEMTQDIKSDSIMPVLEKYFVKE